MIVNFFRGGAREDPKSLAKSPRDMMYAVNGKFQLQGIVLDDGKYGTWHGYNGSTPWSTKFPKVPVAFWKSKILRGDVELFQDKSVHPYGHSEHQNASRQIGSKQIDVPQSEISKVMRMGTITRTRMNKPREIRMSKMMSLSRSDTTMARAKMRVGKATSLEANSSKEMRIATIIRTGVGKAVAIGESKLVRLSRSDERSETKTLALAQNNEMRPEATRQCGSTNRT